jgi:CBS domain-containing protein
MNISEIMTRAVRTCRLDDSVNVAAQLMWDNDCGAIPVVDDAGKVVAVITDRDICMAAYTQGRPLDEIPVQSAASRSVATVRADDSLHRAEQVMSAAHVRRVPVVDADGRPVGILSITDLARQAPVFAGGVASHLVGTMVGICRKETPHAPALPLGEAHSTATA